MAVLRRRLFPRTTPRVTTGVVALFVGPACGGVDVGAERIRTAGDPDPKLSSLQALDERGIVVIESTADDGHPLP